MRNIASIFSLSDKMVNPHKHIKNKSKRIKKIGTFIENFASDVMIHVPPIVTAQAARILVFVKTMELVIQWMDPAPVPLDGR